MVEHCAFPMFCILNLCYVSVIFLPEEDEKKREKMGGPWAVSASSQSPGIVLLH